MEDVWEGSPRDILSEAHTERDRVGEILERLDRVEEKLDDVVARGKKANSLLGMMVGRLPGAKPKGKK